MKRSTMLLVLILAASAALHLWRIDQPSRPVFDEVHFATYASDYFWSRPHLDIHPPLGKILLASPLAVVPSRATNSTFVTLSPNTTTEIYDVWYFKDAFGDFPYVALRLVGAFFGTLLVLAVYCFLRSLFGDTAVPLWGAFFVAFENALLLETRLILINGPYLALGLFSLALYFSRERRGALWGGIIWGMSLATKLIGVVFLGPLIVHAFLSIRDGRAWLSRLKRMGTFACVGIAVLIAFFVVPNNAFFSPKGRLALYHSLIPWVNPTATLRPAPPNVPQALWNIAPYAAATLVELNTSLGGYATGGGSHPFSSMWYAWPAMWKPMTYFEDKHPLILFGNPLLWIGGVLAIAAAFVVLARRAIRGNAPGRETASAWVLVGSYFLAFSPFAAIDRVAFLYHYFPALIFSLSLLAYLFARYLENKPVTERRILAVLAVVAVVGAFLFIAPYTYGF